MKRLFLNSPHISTRRYLLSLLVLLYSIGGLVLVPGSPALAQTKSKPEKPQTPQIDQTSDHPNFGSNVYIFDPTMPQSQIQSTVDSIAAQQVDNEMGSQRYSLLFKPGTYGSAAQPLVFQVGYYTEVAGLGASPNDVVINGHIDVYNRCLTPDNCIALTNFWRSLSNLSINVTGLADCRASGNFWAVSQASPMRRVHITGGNLTLMDYCTAGPQYASGGFIADSNTGFVVNGSQQQFLVRNSTVGGWSNAVWNQVFSGVEGAPAQSFPDPPYTTLATSPVTEEKPFLYTDQQGNYKMFVPSVTTNTSGTSWANGQTPGTSIPLREFYVAKPGDSATLINLALLLGYNLIFTPGVYHLNQTIEVLRPHTVIYGMGMATLIPDRGLVAMRVISLNDVKISGLIFDAGANNSPSLLQVGLGMPAGISIANPVLLSDVFFRIGGAGAGKATTSLIVNNNNTILDDIWAWRADHGTGVGWTVNTADTGVIVNASNVTAYGLFVEHYQKNEVIWNGNNGTTIFFQNEMPYDPPDQASWKNGTMNGYAAFKVADRVTQFQGYGMGSYCFFNVNPSVNAYHAFEVPNRAGVQLHDLLTISLNAGTITHVVNDTGDVTPPGAVPVYLVSYP